jgi:octopine oxidase subunit A
MGPCQGRMCGLSVAQIMADSQKRRIEDIGHFRARTPVRQITLGELASFSTNKGFSILDMRK